MLPFLFPLLAYSLAANPIGAGRLALDALNSFRGVQTSRAHVETVREEGVLARYIGY